MATQALSDVANLVNVLSNLFLDKKTTKTTSVDPAALANLNQIIASMMPQITAPAVSEADIQNLIQNVLTNRDMQLAKTRFDAGKLGGYNSSALKMLEEHAQARAIQEAAREMINARLAAAQVQQNAAQIAAQAAGQQLQGTRKEVQTTQAPLGDLALPLGIYAGYKWLTNAGKAADTAGKAVKAADAAGKAAKAAGVGTGAATASTLPTSLFADSTAGVGNLFDFLLPAQGAAISPVFTGAAQGAINIPTGGNLPAATSSGGGTSIFGGIGEAASSLFSGLQDTAIGSVLGGIGDTLSSVNSFFTPQIDLGFGSFGVPLLAGVRGLMEGDIGRAAGDIAATAALSAIPVVGPILAIAGGFTKNGILDDWFGLDDCYITTATREALGDDFSDSGEELTTLRDFRSSYMMETPERAAMVFEYQLTAPTIVKALNSRPDSKQIYKHFYRDYIYPSVVSIKAGDNESALKLYSAMVKEAKQLASMEG